MAEMSYLPQEQLRVIYLDTKSHVQAIETIYQGHLHGTTVPMVEMFRAAMRYHRGAVILAHNHPSGDPTPSLPELAMTRQAIEAGNVLGVRVLDHVVIGRGQWVSLKRDLPIFAPGAAALPGGTATLNLDLPLIWPD